MRKEGEEAREWPIFWLCTESLFALPAAMFNSHSFYYNFTEITITTPWGESL